LREPTDKEGAREREYKSRGGGGRSERSRGSRRLGSRKMSVAGLGEHEVDLAVDGLVVVGRRVGRGVVGRDDDRLLRVFLSALLLVGLRSGWFRDGLGRRVGLAQARLLPCNPLLPLRLDRRRAERLLESSRARGSLSCSSFLLRHGACCGRVFLLLLLECFLISISILFVSIMPLFAAVSWSPSPL